MGVGEADAVKGDKPQVHADKSPSAGSVKEFNEALGRSAGSASSTQAAAGTAARASGGKPTIVRIDANYRSKSATATLSDGSKVSVLDAGSRLEAQLGISLQHQRGGEILRREAGIEMPEHDLVDVFGGNSGIG